MRYITAEQFQELPEGVQKVFIDWWVPRMYDLFLSQIGELESMKCCIEDNHTLQAVTKSKGITKFPLLTLGQLWEFLEDTLDEYVEVKFMADAYSVNATLFDDLLAWEEDKLQAFWKAAVKVAKESLREDCKNVNY